MFVCVHSITCFEEFQNSILIWHPSSCHCSSSDGSRGRTGAEGKKKKKKSSQASAGYGSSGSGGGESDPGASSLGSLDSSAASPRDGFGSPVSSRSRSRGSVQSRRSGKETRARVSKWRRHDADAGSGAESSGSEDGLPRGFGELAVKDLAGKRKSRKARGKGKPVRREGAGGRGESSGDDGASSRRGSSMAGSDGEGRGAGARGRGDAARGGVRYEVREMPDGSKKRVEVRDDVNLFHDEGGGTSQRHAASASKEAGVSRPGGREREPEEGILQKAERLQREARMMREAAEHSRRQEVLREAAEYEQHKAQRQVRVILLIVAGLSFARSWAA